jgi:hypothetical protein
MHVSFVDASETPAAQEVAATCVLPLPYFFDMKLMELSLWVWEVAYMVNKAV